MKALVSCFEGARILMKLTTTAAILITVASLARLVFRKLIIGDDSLVGVLLGKQLLETGDFCFNIGEAAESTLKLFEGSSKVLNFHLSMS